MSFKVCAYYTDDRLYIEHAQGLETSMHEIGLTNYIIEKIPTQTQWIYGCAKKSGMIKKWLSEFNENIVYVDVDARFEWFPILFNSFNYDIGYHLKDGVELLSGTLYFKNCDKTKELVNRWENNQHKELTTWDQKVLAKTIAQSTDLKLEIGHLPAPYCMIFDTMEKYGPPVIKHLQASRQYNKYRGNPCLPL